MYKNVGATGCGVRIDVGVDQCCSAIDVDPPALQAVKARSVPNGSVGFVRREATEYNLCGREEEKKRWNARGFDSRGSSPSATQHT